MTLTGPSEALADQSSFIGYLVGLVGLAEVIRTLATDGGAPIQKLCVADDLVHMLLGLASLGGAIERLAEPVTAQHEPPAATPSTQARWLR